MLQIVQSNDIRGDSITLLGEGRVDEGAGAAAIGPAGVEHVRWIVEAGSRRPYNL